MKTSILHITNGDSTTNYLKKLNIQGDFITWREMLCEGKTNVHVGSEHFWKARFEFLKQSYKVTKKQFIDLTLKEYRNLCNQKSQEEIVLWFEYDLFCQINMIAVISWLKKYRKGRKISLVCSGKVKGSNKLLGLSELSAKQLKEHYKNKIELTIDDIAYADYVWQLYCSNDPIKLQNVYQYQQNTTFTYLIDSLLAHLQRFPSISNGLNKIENSVLDIAVNSKLNSQEELVSAILQQENQYGFGDLQYRKQVTDLKDYFSSFSPVKLNKTGVKVQQQILNTYANMRDDFSFLGGAKKYNFLYDNSTQKLLKITSL
ncbi:hypothetical protein KCTC32516_01804 [Polaribacter huanghezhanensis]|uniref:DUF1835 domain-containing protein n=1 Tax=Polaribacter huanghezhanensis TaxID=1354726 RepID=UPI002647EAA0|nr:DUF1835 domain-containing protein [Polaribacter huanghezhanensis]WKD86429.1 hypothetical protein KCTC32516_01804 [Polaribacter huanghezhanensis]